MYSTYQSDADISTIASSLRDTCLGSQKCSLIETGQVFTTESVDACVNASDASLSTSCKYDRTTGSAADASLGKLLTGLNSSSTSLGTDLQGVTKSNDTISFDSAFVKVNACAVAGDEQTLATDAGATVYPIHGSDFTVSEMQDLQPTLTNKNRHMVCGRASVGYDTYGSVPGRGESFTTGQVKFVSPSSITVENTPSSLVSDRMYHAAHAFNYATDGGQENYRTSNVANVYKLETTTDSSSSSSSTLSGLPDGWDHRCYWIHNSLYGYSTFDDADKIREHNTLTQGQPTHRGGVCNFTNQTFPPDWNSQCYYNRYRQMFNWNGYTSPDDVLMREHYVTYGRNGGWSGAC